MKLNALKSLGAGLALLTVATAPSALGALIPLAPNQSITINAAFETVPPPASTLIDSLTSPFANGAFTGTIKSDVYNNAGGLIFVYTVSVTGNTSAHNLDVPVDGFATLVGIPAGGDAHSAYRYNPSEIGFDWNGTPITKGTSDSVIVQTLANTKYEQTRAYLVPTGSTAGANAAILGVAPEPTTMAAGAMLLLPFAASTLRMIRRKNG